MAIGMGYDEFWNCSPSRYIAYREAHKLRVEQKNQEMWMQGLYVFKAIETALHNQPAFSTEPVQPVSYLEEPIRITPYTEQEKIQKEEAQREKELKALTDYLKNFQQNWERKHGCNSR